MSFRSILYAGTIAAVVCAPTLHAQVTASVEGFAGYYRPTGHFDRASVFSTDLPSKPSDLAGPSLGGTVHIGLGRRYGIAAELAATRSQVPQVATPDGPRGPTDARVILGTLVAQYDVSPNPHAYRVWLNAGPAVVHQGGDAYEPHGSPTSYGGAIGTNIAVPLTGRLQLSAGATGLFYTIHVPMPPDVLNSGRLQSGNQRDVLLNLGLAWTLR